MPKKVYISNFYAAGYKINLIDISKGIENTTKADMITLTYEKEKAGDTFKLLDSKDFRTALIATCVVFLVLLFLFLIYKFIGKLNTSKRVKNALINKYNLEETPKSANDEVGDVYAAIAMALSLYQTKMHDEENMVITLEKVARMYSPWSSKIYGLRQIPRK